MRKIRIIARYILLLIFFLMNDVAFSFYKYEEIKIGYTNIQIVEISPENLKIEIARANNGLGKETVDSIAVHRNAKIAINGGFDWW